jgi:hypothetical protein
MVAIPVLKSRMNRHVLILRPRVGAWFRLSPVGLIILLGGMALAALGGCGLRVTNERPTYDQLDSHEKSAVDIILQELQALERQVKTRTPPCTLDPLLDRNRINVSYEGILFTFNFGDGVIHVAAWENLTATQRAQIQTWFGTNAEQAPEAYKKFFYRFIAVGHGVKQFMYNVLTPEWVFAHRYIFSLERDSVRTALAHFAAENRKQEMWDFVTGVCRPVITQFDKTYGHLFTAASENDNYKAAKQYMQDNLAQLAKPSDPSGYLYFLCKAVDIEKGSVEDLTSELLWLRELNLP